jgi:signal transduction histidine kinase
MFRLELTDAEDANRCLRDIVALSTLPALWVGAEPLRVAESLAAALFTTIGADLVYVWIAERPGGAPITLAQTGRYTTDEALAEQLGPDIVRWSRTHDPDELLLLPHPAGSGTLSIATRPLGVNGGVGVVGVGFAAAADLTLFRIVLLNVAATQATTAVQNADLLRSLRESVAERTRRGLQLRQLAEAARVINSRLSVSEILHHITEQARRIIGVHYAVTSLTPGAGRAQAISSVSLSDDYAVYGTCESPPVGAGIGAVVCERNEPMRLTQAELETNTDPPLTGWLAVPLIARGGDNLGVIQLSARYDGEFTAEDEDIMVQLAQLASTAVENANLYEEARAANAAKDEFFTVLSHELRTPLTSILGWAQLCKGVVDDPELNRQALSSIENSARSQAALIDDLLDVSRIMTGKLSIERTGVDFSILVHEALDSIRPAAALKGVALIPALQPGLHLLGDVARLRQVVGNLLSNAVKFTPAGGLIDTRLHVSAGQAVLSVRDTGVGIEPVTIPTIFDRYAQSATGRSMGGLGLGLWIVRHIVSQHGGTISVSSDGLGKGSTFTVTLPL